MYNHEKALREECSYEGYQPYWYEQKDAGKFSSADIFDPIYGFGGDGSGKEGCIVDGPFANYTNRLGPDYEMTDHCIDRKFNDEASSYTSQERIDNCTSQPDWISAWHCIELELHAGGHAGVGGQSKDLPARLPEMGGTNTLREKTLVFQPPPPEYPQPEAMPGDPGNITTLNHVIFMFGNMENKIIADVMDIQGDFLSYEYIEPTY